MSKYVKAGDDMPSRAYSVFKKNLEQVDRLLHAYRELMPNTRGRKHLDHLTRSALIFLCSSWEVYVEQVTLEASSIIASRLSSPNELPITVRKNVSSCVKKHKHELEPINLAVDWRAYYLNWVSNKVSALNTPKNGHVLELLNKHLGASGEDVKRGVPTLEQVNEIVKLRGEIAHNVFAESYVYIDRVVAHKDVIVQVVREIDLFLWDYIPEIVPPKRPWRNTY